MTLTEGLILRGVFLHPVHPGGVRLARYYLVYLYMRHRQIVPGPLPEPDPLPVVTVQLPIYNELYVVERLIEAVCAIDYPRDSSRSRCSTTRPTRRARSPSWPSAATPRRASTSSTSTAPTAPATRPARSKPGLKVARGEFVAIFDADFVAAARLPAPHRAALRRPEGRHGAGALGPPQPRLLAAHARPGDLARRPLRARARRPQPRRPLLQLQRHRRHLAARRRSTTPAAGSTTR